MAEFPAPSSTPPTPSPYDMQAPIGHDEEPVLGQLIHIGQFDIGQDLFGMDTWADVGGSPISCGEEMWGSGKEADLQQVKVEGQWGWVMSSLGGFVALIAWQAMACGDDWCIACLHACLKVAELACRVVEITCNIIYLFFGMDLSQCAIV